MSAEPLMARIDEVRRVLAPRKTAPLRTQRSRLPLAFSFATQGSRATKLNESCIRCRGMRLRQVILRHVGC
jgi:hypothetical protein